MEALAVDLLEDLQVALLQLANVMNNPKKVFRVDHQDRDRGLWYTVKGDFTGEIHQELSFCKSSALKMPYDEALADEWRSATSSATELLHWFTVDELERLEDHGYSVTIYKATEHKLHSYKDPDTKMKISHVIFNKHTAELIDTVSIKRFRQILETESKSQ